MSFCVSWSNKALDRLASILDYIADDNPAAALALVDRISDRVVGLQDTPEVGSRYLGSRVGGLRQLIVHPYRVVYLVDDPRKSVHVVAVQHMREDTVSAESLLENEEA
jgi:addiction module RelE/StbE family toxin